MSDDRDLIDRDAMKITAVLALLAGARRRLAGGRGWENTVGGALIAVIGWLGTTPFQALRELPASVVWREVWGHQLPWLLIALIGAAVAANRGIVL